MKVFISSCGTGESLYGRELKRMAELCTSLQSVFVDRPEDADLILVVDMDEANVFANLRRNQLWRRFPEKSFGIYEGDNPAPFLHGLYSSVRRSWMRTGRFQSCAYPMHQICFPNKVPAVSRVTATPKDLLFFFAGRLSHPVRKRLLKLRFPETEVVVQDTSTYNHFQSGDPNDAANARYWQLAQRSKFGLCPRGAGTSSVRLFELMEAAIAPVIIADDWVPPIGPKWEEFALFVPEREIASLYKLLQERGSEWMERGQKARQAYETWFAPQVYWRFLIHSIQVIQKHQRVPETTYTRMLPWITLRERTRQARIGTLIRIKGMIRKSLIRRRRIH